MRWMKAIIYYGKVVTKFTKIYIILLFKLNKILILILLK
jgi:hypothetical protein